MTTHKERLETQIELGAGKDDALRLDALQLAGGFVRGSDAGAPAFRIFGFDSWHDSLRTAIDKGPLAIATSASGEP